MAMSRQRLWIGAAVVVLGVVVLSAEREDPPRCEVRVSADVLNVRSAPGTEHPIVDRLTAGAVTEAGGTVRNGFRQVGEGRWVASQYLTETPGSVCE